MSDPVEAIGSALRGEVAPLSRMGIAMPPREVRRIRRLLRLRWVPFLKAELRVQRRILRSLEDG